MTLRNAVRSADHDGRLSILARITGVPALRLRAYSLGGELEDGELRRLKVAAEDAEVQP